MNIIAVNMQNVITSLEATHASVVMPIMEMETTALVRGFLEFIRLS